MSLSTLFSLLTSEPPSTPLTEDGVENSTIESVNSTEFLDSGTTLLIPTQTDEITNNITTDEGSFTTEWNSPNGTSEFELASSLSPENGSFFLEENFTESIKWTNISTSLGPRSSYSVAYNVTTDIPSSSTTSDLDLEDLNDDIANRTEFGVDLEKYEPFGDVPVFYILLAFVVGFYIYLYILSRHLKAKAVNAMEQDQKKRIEERAKRGGCRYDFEDDDESDCGPPEQ